MKKYEKPVTEVIRFGSENVFMTASGEYSSAGEALQAACGGYDGGKTNKFSCSSFGGYSASNPPTQHSTVTLGGGTYVFDYVGNHWKLAK